MKLVAILLIALGIMALAYQGITYSRKRDAVDLGPIQVTTEEKKTIPLSPIFGVVALAGGVALLMSRSKRTA